MRVATIKDSSNNEKILVLKGGEFFLDGKELTDNQVRDYDKLGILIWESSEIRSLTLGQTPIPQTSPTPNSLSLSPEKNEVQKEHTHQLELWLGKVKKKPVLLLLLFIPVAITGIIFTQLPNWEDIPRSESEAITDNEAQLLDEFEYERSQTFENPPFEIRLGSAVASPTGDIVMGARVQAKEGSSFSGSPDDIRVLIVFYDSWGEELGFTDSNGISYFSGSQARTNYGTLIVELAGVHGAAKADIYLVSTIQDGIAWGNRDADVATIIDFAPRTEADLTSW